MATMMAYEAVRYALTRCLGTCAAALGRALGNGVAPTSKLKQVLVRDVATQSQWTYTSVRASA
eukprot:4935732-Alexandrium_andersonii.AAC.1